MMNIIDAIKDENLFRRFLADADGGLETWNNWRVALRCLYGLPLWKGRDVVRECTGRDPDQLPDAGFDTALFLTGRRSGKSRIAALIGAYEALLTGAEQWLAPGEQGMVAVLSPSRSQSRIVKSGLRAVFDSNPMLEECITAESREGFELSNGIRIEIATGDWRTIRGFTLIAAIVDEAAFFGLDSEAKVRSDTELIRAIKPALATTGGKLVAISTPYAKKGWCWQTFQKHFGKNRSNILVWNCPSRVMNPTLPQSVVDEALAEDRAAALAEYLGQFRDDVSDYIGEALVRAVVVPGRKELLWNPRTSYQAFVDLSGGRHDDATAAVAHRDRGQSVIVDKVMRFQPPFDPHKVVRQIATELRRWGIHRVTGDNYAGEWVSQAFAGAGMGYTRCEKPKSELYLDLLPMICARAIELPDDPALIEQISTLERRARSGGKDVVDHRVGSKDDLANVVAGVASVSTQPRIRVGAL